jgi:hypothetical protein
VQFRIALATALLVLTATARPHAAELQARTVTAYNRYVQLTQQRMDGGGPFIIGTMPRATDLLIERMTTRESGGREVDVPGGLIHHWMGTVFLPNVSVEQVTALLQDYNNQAQIYRPMVARSRLISRNGDTFRFHLRFVTKKVITVVVNSDHEARFTRPAPGRVEARVHSTRIQEVEDADTPQETELPAGNDGGYLWRLNTFWRVQAGNGGTYVQCESISLTRRIPAAFSWLIGPFVNSVPRETLQFTMDATRARFPR